MMYPPSLLPCKTRGLLCAAAMVLPTFGCESTTPEVDDPALVTDGTAFQLVTENSRGHVWYRTEIPYSFTNRTGSTVYIPNCSGPFWIDFGIALQMEEDGEWGGIWAPFVRLCLSPPIVIEPDEVYHATLSVVGCLVGNCGPRLTLPPTESTPIRIKWTDALSSYDPDADPFGELIPLEERVSNSFTLQLPR